MLVDATDKFAERMAKWLFESKLNHLEITRRLSMFPDAFINKVITAHRRLARR